MSITSLSPEVEKPQHFASCTQEAIGRRVLDWHLAFGGSFAFTLDELTKDLDLHRGKCRCFEMQLEKVEADLTVARKAQKAGRDKTAVIADLTAHRDALKAVTA